MPRVTISSETYYDPDTCVSAGDAFIADGSIALVVEFNKDEFLLVDPGCGDCYFSGTPFSGTTTVEGLKKKLRDDHLFDTDDLHYLSANSYGIELSVDIRR